MKEAEEALERGCDRMSKEQIENLKDRLNTGVFRLREAYEDAGDRVKEVCADVEESISDYYAALEEKIRDRLQETDQSLRSHPYQTAAVAFAAGMMLGAFLASSSKR